MLRFRRIKKNLQLAEYHLYGSSAQGRFATWKPDNVDYDVTIYTPESSSTVNIVISQKEFEVILIKNKMSKNNIFIKNIVLILVIIFLTTNCSYFEYASGIYQEGKINAKNYKLFFHNLGFEGKVFNKYSSNEDFYCIIKFEKINFIDIVNIVNKMNSSYSDGFNDIYYNYYYKILYKTDSVFSRVYNYKILNDNISNNLYLEIILNEKMFEILKKNDTILKNENQNEIYINDKKFDYMLDTNESDWLFEN